MVTTNIGEWTLTVITSRQMLGLKRKELVIHFYHTKDRCPRFDYYHFAANIPIFEYKLRFDEPGDMFLDLSLKKAKELVIHFMCFNKFP